LTDSVLRHDIVPVGWADAVGYWLMFDHQVRIVVDCDYTWANEQHCRGFHRPSLDRPLIGKLYHARSAGS
jgi:hypothetical protein